MSLLVGVRCQRQHDATHKVICAHNVVIPNFNLDELLRVINIEHDLLVPLRIQAFLLYLRFLLLSKARELDVGV